MFNSPPNPYVVGNPLTDPTGFGFYGRQEVYRFLQDKLNAVRRPTILLHGHRRIGKTSILRQVPRFLPPDFVTAFIDVQGQAYDPFDDLLYGMTYEIRCAVNLRRFNRENLTPDYFFSTFLPKVFDKLDGQKRKLILLFDEFDVLDPQAEHARHFLNFMRRLTIKEPEVGYIIVVGEDPQNLAKAFREITHIHYRIGRLSRSEIDALIRSQADGLLTFSDETVERIWELTSGHPLITNLVCFELWSQLVGQKLVSLKAVDQIIPAVLRAGENQLNQIYDGLSKPSYQLFLSAVAENSTRNKPAKLKDIQMALAQNQVNIEPFLEEIRRDLIAWDILVENSDGFQFTVELIRQWVAEKRSLASRRPEAMQIDERAFRLYQAAEDLRLADNPKDINELRKVWKPGEALHQRKNELEGALANYQHALSRNPYLLAARVGLSKVALELGNVELATNESEKAFEADSQYWEIYRDSLLRFGKQYEEKNNWQMALAKYELILELDENDTSANDSRSRLLTRQGQIQLEKKNFSKAIEFFEKAGNLTKIEDAQAQWDTQWNKLINSLDEKQIQRNWSEAFALLMDYGSKFSFDKRIENLRQKTEEAAKAWWSEEGERLLANGLPSEALKFFEKAEANAKVKSVRKALTEIKIEAEDKWLNLRYPVVYLLLLFLCIFAIFYLSQLSLSSQPSSFIIRIVNTILLFFSLHIFIKNIVVMPISFWKWYRNEKLAQLKLEELPVLLHNSIHRRTAYSSAFSLALATIIIEYNIRLDYNLPTPFISLLTGGLLGLLFGIIAYMPYSVSKGLISKHYNYRYEDYPRIRQESGLRDLIIIIYFVIILPFFFGLLVYPGLNTFYFYLWIPITFYFSAIAFRIIMAFVNDFS